MSDQTTGGEPTEAPLPLTDAPLVGEQPTTPKEAGAKGWKSPVRITSLAVAAVLVVAAAVVVPLKLTAARSVSAAVGGVFSQPTVRFTLTATGPATKGETVGDSIVVTLAGKNGNSVADGTGAVDIEAILGGSKSLFDLRVTSGGLYFRLDPAALSALPPTAHAPSPAKVVARLQRLAHQHPALSFLDEVAAGKWVGVSKNTLESTLKRLKRQLGTIYPAAHGKIAPKEAHKLVQQVGTAFGQTWDELVSLHKVGPSDGATEYSVDLPLRSFVEGVLHRLAKEPTSGVPGLGHLLKAALSSDLHVPAVNVPVDLWIAGGSLVKIAVTHSGATVAAAIAHPSAPVSPTGVSYISVRQIRRLFAMTFLGMSRGSGYQGFYSGSGTASASAKPPADMRLIAALTMVQMSYAGAHSFSELFNPTSNYSLSHLGPPKAFQWRKDAASTSPSEMSIHVGPNSSYVVIADYLTRKRSCEGVLFVTHRTTGSLLGAPRKAGGAYAFHEKVAGSSCNAASITSVPAKPWSGWYGYAPLSATGTGSGN